MAEMSSQRSGRSTPGKACAARGTNPDARNTSGIDNETQPVRNDTNPGVVPCEERRLNKGKRNRGPKSPSTDHAMFQQDHFRQLEDIESQLQLKGSRGILTVLYKQSSARSGWCDSAELQLAAHVSRYTPNLVVVVSVHSAPASSVSRLLSLAYFAGGETIYERRLTNADAQSFQIRLCARCVRADRRLALIRGHWSVIAARPSSIIHLGLIRSVCPCRVRLSMPQWSSPGHALQTDQWTVRDQSNALTNQYLGMLMSARNTPLRELIEPALQIPSELKPDLPPHVCNVTAPQMVQAAFGLTCGGGSKTLNGCALNQLAKLADCMEEQEQQECSLNPEETDGQALSLLSQCVGQGQPASNSSNTLSLNLNLPALPSPEKQSEAWRHQRHRNRRNRKAVTFDSEAQSN